MSRVRLALVGHGRWGRNYVKAAEDSGEAEVVRVVRQGEPVSTAGIDAAVIATPPKASAEWCRSLIPIGLPVLAEKPVGLSLSDAESIYAVAGDRALVLVGHQHLFSSIFEAVRYAGKPDKADATFRGPVTRDDYSPLWDYGPHAVACLLALGVDPTASAMSIGSGERTALVDAWHGGVAFRYDGYAPQEPPLTRQVRAFAKAVKAGGTDDYRFGAKWAVDVARVLEACESR